MLLSLWNRTLGWLALAFNRARRRAVLRLGFAIIIALLVFTAVQADRIQDSASRQTVEVYQRHVRQQDALGEFRRNLLMGTIYARDFFLSQWPDRVEAFNSQLEHLKIDLLDGLEQIQRMEGLRDAVPALRAKTGEYLETLARVADETRPDRTFEVVERELAERRVETSQIAAQLAADSQQALRRSEAEYAERRQSATHRLFLMLGSCLLIALCVALFSIIYAEHLEEKSARRYEDAMQAQRDLQRLSARLLEIQEQERRRFARELHDEIGQSLTAMRMEISEAQSAARDAPSRQRLEAARRLAEKTTQAVRDISLMLRPSLLDDLGLGPALEWQAEEHSRRTGMRCELTVDGLEPGLPDPFNIGVYRIVQEALHNAEKHSGASRVEVLVRQAGGWLTVEVADNGRGFAAHARNGPRRSGGLGMLGMRERAEMLGGSLSVESEIGKGARVTLRIPALRAALTPEERPMEAGA